MSVAVPLANRVYRAAVSVCPVNAAFTSSSTFGTSLAEIALGFNTRVFELVQAAVVATFLSASLLYFAASSASR